MSSLISRSLPRSHSIRYLHCLIAFVLFHAFTSTLAATGKPKEVSSEIPPPLVKRVVRSPENTYFTYPHSNGFMPDGRAVIARPTVGGKTGKGVDYIAFALDSGESKVLAHVDEARWYYAIAENGLMVVPTGHGGVVTVDLISGTQTKIFSDPNCSIAADIDISKDGKRILLTQSCHGARSVFHITTIDTKTGKANVIFDKWMTDHAHFSPFDQRWICFCDNRQPNHDRMWVWHDKDAPHGRNVFNQKMPDGNLLEVGHERAMFNKRALITVAYGGSKGTPRGLYEVGFNGKVRLVSEANCDFHCNISHDGRWAVVTAEGTVADKNGKLDLRHRPVSGWLQTGPTYGYSDVMLVNMKSGARQFLYRGTNDVNHQPYEVQPSISPDDRWVLLKDAREHRVLALEINQGKLEKFLR